MLILSIEHKFSVGSGDIAKSTPYQEVTATPATFLKDGNSVILDVIDLQGTLDSTNVIVGSKIQHWLDCKTIWKYIC